ncbi:hypothetical protein FQA39_LY19336 [Lamprigera yunnana]|nr:hypothetical protein FQA39_LY19336 [Lamprigera yunnana]
MPEAVASTSSFDVTTNANAEDQHLPEERKTKFLDKGVQVYIKPHFRSKATTTELITTMDNATSTITVIVKSVTTSPITVKQLLIPDLDVTRTTTDTSSSVSQISMNSFYTDKNDSTESDYIDEIRGADKSIVGFVSGHLVKNSKQLPVVEKSAMVPYIVPQFVYVVPVPSYSIEAPVFVERPLQHSDKLRCHCGSC